MKILEIRKNGNVTASQLDEILCAMIADMIPKIMEPLLQKINDQSDRLKRLESDLESERRLRLSMKR